MEKVKKMVYEQNENINTEKENLKRFQNNFGAAKYNNRTENFTKEIQRHIWAGKRKNLQTWRWGKGNYRVWGTERKKIEKRWTKPKEPMEYCQENQQMHCGVQEEEKLAEKRLGKKTEKYPNLIKHMNINIQEARWTQSKLNSKRQTLRQIIIKLSKDKDKEIFLKAASDTSYTRDPQ